MLGSRGNLVRGQDEADGHVLYSEPIIEKGFRTTTEQKHKLAESSSPGGPSEGLSRARRHETGSTISPEPVR